MKRRHLKLMYKVKVLLQLADITHDSDVEILNPDLHIATLASNGHLRMRLTAKRGRGYTPADAK